jgi:hypothetical protein
MTLNEPNIRICREACACGSSVRVWHTPVDNVSRGMAGQVRWRLATGYGRVGLRMTRSWMGKEPL